jgi:hypothetical protein
MFVTESGNVHLCFLAEPIGNLYAAPLAEIWNSPRALAIRSRLISGRYLAAACSEPSCAWRDGRTPVFPVQNETRQLLLTMKDLRERAARLQPGESCETPALNAVRRLLKGREQSSLEWEALFLDLCETNAALHERGQVHIDHLESELRAARQAHGDLLVRQSSRLVRIALKASRALNKLGLGRSSDRR